MLVDDWEIPFENISDLQWLGSGAQGAVFLGKLRGEFVAIKKLRDKRETDIRHLRKLNHPNIISFKYDARMVSFVSWVTLIFYAASYMHLSLIHI